MKTDELFECVANFSEGRRHDVIDRIVRAASKSAKVLDLHSDPDHNRSVLTIAGEKDSILEAAIDATDEAAQLIDLRSHKGEHPRLGAMDVVPFVPLKGSSIESAVAIARNCAARISSELSIPTFLYESAARSGDPTDLPSIRRGAFRSLTPDFGGPDPHPTAGATVVGARNLLVAFNVNLSTKDVVIAGRVARAVRERDGGLKHVRALAFELVSRSLVQVSMNLTSPEETTLDKVLRAVQAAAATERVGIVGTELVGVAPLRAFGGRRPEELGLEPSAKVLEEVLDQAFS
ncbi:MAG: glutamate formimidoyltransferase [Acidimicrobiia bacterium]